MLLNEQEYFCLPCDEDSDYDDGTDDSCASRDWDSEPGDDNWIGRFDDENDDDDENNDDDDSA